jgi:predicted GNAT superfamily acetyltransferase
MQKDIEIRECVTHAELAECVELQRDVFALPEVELSPVRHLIVTKNAGGFTLGAFDGTRLAGFVLSVPAFLRGERAFYSHMTGVRPEYQSLGIGARLKWAQRKRALEEGVRYVKWTFEPIKARNAYFNLEKLGATVGEYQVDFYGTDYATAAQTGKRIGLASDRLFAEWDLRSPKVEALAGGGTWEEKREVVTKVAIINDFLERVASNPEAVLGVQLRIRNDFLSSFGQRLMGRGFERGEEPKYLMYAD